MKKHKSKIKQGSKTKSKNHKPIHLDMPFEEAMLRLSKVKPPKH